MTSGIKWMLLNQGVVTINALLEKSITTTINDQTPTGISLFLNIFSVLTFSSSSVVSFMFAENLSVSLVQVIRVVLSVFPWYFLMLVAVSGVLAMGIGMSYFALNTSQSPTSIKVTNNLARLLSVALGAYIFGDSLSFISFVGMFVCLVFGLVYSSVK